MLVQRHHAPGGSDMKRLIVVLVVALAALSACGSDSENASGDTDTTVSGDSKASDAPETTDAASKDKADANVDSDTTSTDADPDDADPDEEGDADTDGNEKKSGTDRDAPSADELAGFDDIETCAGMADYLVTMVADNIDRLNKIDLEEAEDLSEEELIGTLGQFDDTGFDQRTVRLRCDQAELTARVCDGFADLDAQTRTAELMLESLEDSTCTAGGSVDDVGDDVSIAAPEDVETSSEFCDIVESYDADLDSSDPQEVAIAYRDIAELAPSEAYTQFDIVASAAEAVADGASEPPAGITEQMFQDALDYIATVIETNCNVDMT